jgi:transcriptional regulator with XRE-family HTH domain
MSEARVRLGTAVRDARQDRGWSQAVLARSAGVSQPLVSIVESGRVGASIDSLTSIAEALDAELVIELRPPRLIGRLDQQDPAHARCVAACRRTLEAAGLACAVEREIVDGRLRGWIDLLGFDLSSRRLVLAEIKAEIRDVGGLERQVGWYVRACMSAVRDLGWQPKEIAVVVALLATAANDAFVVANRLALAQAFPMRGAALAAAIFDGGPVAGWGLAMVDPRRRGGHAIQSLASTVDGATRPIETTRTSCASSGAAADRDSTDASASMSGPHG